MRTRCRQHPFQQPLRPSSQPPVQGQQPALPNGHRHLGGDHASPLGSNHRLTATTPTGAAQPYGPVAAAGEAAPGMRRCLAQRTKACPPHWLHPGLFGGLAWLTGHPAYLTEGSPNAGGHRREPASSWRSQRASAIQQHRAAGTATEARWGDANASRASRSQASGLAVDPGHTCRAASPQPGRHHSSGVALGLGVFVVVPVVSRGGLLGLVGRRCSGGEVSQFFCMAGPQAVAAVRLEGGAGGRGGGRAFARVLEPTKCAWAQRRLRGLGHRPERSLNRGCWAGRSPITSCRPVVGGPPRR
jgi:hypothetical protein